MKVIEVEGKSLDDARKKAARELGVHISMINDGDIEILDKGKSGIFGFGVSRPAKIRVSYNINIEDIGENVTEILNTLFNKMSLDCAIAEIHESESKVYVELESSNSGLVIGKKGKTLEAIQFLVNLIVNKEVSSDKKIILDIEAYRAKRERALRRLSKDIAKQVAKSGRPWTLDPMNPFERRLIHLTLQNDTRVTTKSEGQGVYRQVRVFPKKG
jgi:spoIIIJ-associated protein